MAFFECRISNRELGISKEQDKFDLEERLIGFVARVIRTAELLPKRKRIRLHNLQFLVRHSTLNQHVK